MSEKIGQLRTIKMKYREDENHNLILVDGKVIPEKERTRCEIYSRVVGYLRPVSQYNPGKKSEFRDRVVFKKDKEVNDE